MAANGETDMFTAWNWNMTWLNQHCMARFGIQATERQFWMRDTFGIQSHLTKLNKTKQNTQKKNTLHSYNQHTHTFSNAGFLLCHFL